MLAHYSFFPLILNPFPLILNPFPLIQNPFPLILSLSKD